jgi:hypothetical protein
MIPSSERPAELVRGPYVLNVGCADHTLEPESPHWLHGQLVKRFTDAVGFPFSLPYFLFAHFNMEFVFESEAEL